MLPACCFAVEAGTVEWAVADFAEPPGNGWKLIDSAQFAQNRASFIAHYNANKGLNVLEAWKSGSCCFAVKGGKKLMIPTSSFGFQFPAANNQMQCNPAGGYAANKYGFFMMPVLKSDTKFAFKDGCKVGGQFGYILARNASR